MGRPSRQGEGNGRARLTEAVVLQLRHLYRSDVRGHAIHGPSLSTLGKLYRVHRMTIWAALVGRSWGFLPLPRPRTLEEKRRVIATCRWCTDRMLWHTRLHPSPRPTPPWTKQLWEELGLDL